LFEVFSVFGMARQSSGWQKGQGKAAEALPELQLASTFRD
jgi:hypothetical protein